MIYLDNAATTYTKPRQVIDAVSRSMLACGNCDRGTHEGSLGASRTVYEARVKLAGFFGCPRADRVVFTSNVTMALNIAIRGLVDPGDHVVSTDLEHNSVLRPLYLLRDTQGVTPEFAGTDEKGCLDYDALRRLLRPGTKAVVCTHASNLTGNLTDIARIRDILTEVYPEGRRPLLIVDAAQTAGTVPIDMQKLGIDVLCFTGHKSLMGPQGTGGLCVREGVEIRPLLTGGTGVQSYSEFQPEVMPTRLEAGTLNVHGIAGLSAAVDFIRETGIDTIHKKEIGLLERFLEGVRKIPDIRLYGDYSKDRTAIAALNLGDCDAGTVADALAVDYEIATRAGAHCAPRMHRALGTERQGAVRFSFGYFNSEEDVDAAVRALKEIAER